MLRSTAVGSECHSLVLLVITLEAAFRDTIGNTYLQQAGWAVLAEFVCSLRVTGELTVRQQLHLLPDAKAMVPSSAMLHTPSEINPVQTSRGLSWIPGLHLAFILSCPNYPVSCLNHFPVHTRYSSFYTVFQSLGTWGIHKEGR